MFVNPAWPAGARKNREVNADTASHPAVLCSLLIADRKTLLTNRQSAIDSRYLLLIKCSTTLGSANVDTSPT